MHRKKAGKTRMMRRPEGTKRNEAAQYIQGMLHNCLMAATL